MFGAGQSWNCITLLSIVASLSWMATKSEAQLQNPIPPIPIGETPIYLGAFASGLPVQQEFITPVFTQRVGPTDLAEVPDGSGDLVITNYGGTAFRLDSAGVQPDQPFLDLLSPDSPSYNADFEFGGAHGLTSIAFHPGFSEPTHPGYRKFYTIEPEPSGTAAADFVDSVIPGDHHQEVVYEYTLDAVGDSVCSATCAASKRELMRVQQPGWHHNFGDLLFDPDGFLYVSSADGNVAGGTPPVMSDNSRLLSNVFGKILRIDPLGHNSENGNYGVPSDNPFVDGPGGNLDEIYAFGLRNPYRIEFDQLTGEMYASETGETSVESIERIAAGANLGWNLKEGSYAYDRRSRTIFEDIDRDGDGVGDIAGAHGLTEPVLQYDRDEGRAVVGAVPYRGQAIPQLEGNILFADFSGRLFYGDPKTGEPRAAAIDENGEAVPFNVHSVNQDLDGDVYLLGITRDGDAFDGVVVKLFASPTAPGDHNGDGQLDAFDLDLLSKLVREGANERLFDLNSDGVINASDRLFWVKSLLDTQLGDANLDGLWNSSDFVAVFQAGEYEDAIALNSGWSEGDWNGDGDFTSRDFVDALLDGVFEGQPARVVPEPSGGMAVALLTLLFWRRRNH